jgi:murein DD-endopeptidase MepM/ murein hydrolase activator NlpD
VFRHHLRPPAIAIAVLGVLAALVVALTAAASPADDAAAADDQARAAAESVRAESAERVDQGRAGVEADRQAALAAQRAAKEKAQAEAEAQAQAEAAARAEAERKAAEERAARSAERAAADPKAIARELMDRHGWGGDQFSCLEQLWEKESRWDHTAQNPSSGAYGIPQALPGSKMASAGSDWQTNPATQIEWGLGYIAERYGTPCSAWGHSQSANWY